MFIIIGAIILPASFVAFTAVFNHFSTPDYVVKARFYADRKFAELTRYPYSNPYLNEVNETAGEDIANSGGFKWRWKIKYVDPYDTAEPFKEVATDNGYKVITVTIKAPDLTEYVMPLLISNRPKQ